MKTFTIGVHEYTAENCINDVLINPLLPDAFDTEPLHSRLQYHIDKWYHVPYILSDNGFYTVRCLDGGARDRSSLKGGFDSLDKAIDFIAETYRK